MWNLICLITCPPHCAATRSDPTLIRVICPHTCPPVCPQTCSQEQAGNCRGRFVVEGRADVAVDAEGDRDRGVAEAFLDDPRMDALLQSERRPRVAEAVEGEPRQAALGDSAEELGADSVGSEAGAVGVVEDQALVGEVGADEQAFLEHQLAVLAQHGDGRRRRERSSGGPATSSARRS